METKTMKVVYTVIERGGKSYWTRVGVGFVNQDGSLNLRLDAIPTNGTLQVRDYEPLDKRGEGRRDGPPTMPPRDEANDGRHAAFPGDALA